MDYVFVSAAVQVDKVEYDQSGRAPGLSDHAIVRTTLKLQSP